MLEHEGLHLALLGDEDVLDLADLLPLARHRRLADDLVGRGGQRELLLLLLLLPRRLLLGRLLLAGDLPRDQEGRGVT